MITHVIKIEDGAPVDFPLTVENLNNSIKSVSIENLENIGYAPVNYTKSNGVTEPWLKVGEPVFTLQDSGWVDMEHPVVDKAEDEFTLDMCKNHLKHMTANYRYSYQLDGINHNGSLISTDNASLQHIASVKQSFDSANITSVNWKCQDGTFITLDSSEFSELSNSVKAFIELCFDAEKTINEEIQALSNLDDIKAYSPRIRVRQEILGED